MKKLLRIGFKDVRITARDRSALGILLAMPAVLILILNMAFGGLGTSSKPVPTAIVNADKGEIAAHIVDGFTKNADIKKITTVTLSTDEAAMRRKVQQGDLAAVLIIPADFSEGIAAGKKVSMEVLGDPGQQVSASIFAGIADAIGTRISAAAIAAQTTAGVLEKSRFVTSAEQVSAYVTDAVNRASAADALSGVVVKTRGVESTSTTTFDPTDFYAASQAALFLLFGSMFGAFGVLAERRQQTLARLFTTPTGRTSIVGGKMLGIWVVGVLQFVVLMAFTLAIGSSWGSIPGALLIGMAEAFAATGLAMVYVAFCKTERAVGAVGPTVALLMGAAGGSWMPVFAMPAWFRPIHYFTISGWALDGFFALQNGDPVSSVMLNIAVLLTFGLVLGVIGVWRLRWEQ